MFLGAGRQPSSYYVPLSFKASQPEVALIVIPNNPISTLWRHNLPSFHWISGCLKCCASQPYIDGHSWAMLPTRHAVIASEAFRRQYLFLFSSKLDQNCRLLLLPHYRRLPTSCSSFRGCLPSNPRHCQTPFLTSASLGSQKYRINSILLSQEQSVAETPPLILELPAI